MSDCAIAGVSRRHQVTKRDDHQLELAAANRLRQLQADVPATSELGLSLLLSVMATSHYGDFPLTLLPIMATSR